MRKTRNGLDGFSAEDQVEERRAPRLDIQGWYSVRDDAPPYDVEIYLEHVSGDVVEGTVIDRMEFKTSTKVPKHDVVWVKQDGSKPDKRTSLSQYRRWRTDRPKGAISGRVLKLLGSMGVAATKYDDGIPNPGEVINLLTEGRTVVCLKSNPIQVEAGKNVRATTIRKMEDTVFWMDADDAAIFTSHSEYRLRNDGAGILMRLLKQQPRDFRVVTKPDTMPSLVRGLEELVESDLTGMDYEEREEFSRLLADLSQRMAHLINLEYDRKTERPLIRLEDDDDDDE